MALCLHELARSHQERGEYARAGRLYRRGLVMAQRMDAAQLIARFLNALAHIDADRGEYRSALTLYRRARLILRGLADRKETQRTLGGMADIYRNRREYPQALKLVTECLRLAQSLPDVPGVARALAQMSAIHTLMGNHVQALQHQSRSLALKEELGDLRGIVESLTRLTRLHVSLGDFDRAVPLLERGLKLSSEFGLARNEILLMEERAICELAHGRLAEAEATAGEALSRAANLEFNEGLARGYRLMGLVHKRLNHYEVSQRHLNRALKHFKRLRRDAETEELLEEIRSVSRENLQILLGLREEMLANTRRLEDEILQRYGRRTVLLMAELEGLASSLGEEDIEPAMEAMQRQDEVLVPRLLCAGGTILRHVGDRVLARFDASGPAIAAALAIQGELDASSRDAEVARPRVRMAVHCGLVAEHAGQVSGQIVDVLGRLLRLASADGIIITGEVRDDCGQGLPVAAHELPEQRTRGGGPPLRVYRLEAA
jgi:class 3 adenylate cyclase